MAYAPEPDLFIRTGGEQRISNFLLWQLAYTELYFTDLLWPDFDAAALDAAIASYRQRERRFGRTSEQVAGRAPRLRVPAPVRPAPRTAATAHRSMLLTRILTALVLVPLVARGAVPPAAGGLGAGGARLRQPRPRGSGRACSRTACRRARRTRRRRRRWGSRCCSRRPRASALPAGRRRRRRAAARRRDRILGLRRCPLAARAVAAAGAAPLALAWAGCVLLATWVALVAAAGALALARARRDGPRVDRRHRGVLRGPRASAGASSRRRSARARPGRACTAGWSPSALYAAWLLVAGARPRRGGRARRPLRRRRSGSRSRSLLALLSVGRRPLRVAAEAPGRRQGQRTAAAGPRRRARPHRRAARRDAGGRAGSAVLLR